MLFWSFYISFSHNIIFQSFSILLRSYIQTLDHWISEQIVLHVWWKDRSCLVALYWILLTHVEILSFVGSSTLFTNWVERLSRVIEWLVHKITWSVFHHIGSPIFGSSDFIIWRSSHYGNLFSIYLWFYAIVPCTLIRLVAEVSTCCKPLRRVLGVDNVYLCLQVNI